MSGGSQQLRRFRIAMRDGATIEDAASAAGISLTEARLHHANDLKNPPGENAFVLLAGNPPAPDAPRMKDDDMARAKRQEQVEEVGIPDFAKAVSIYRKDIKPAQSKVGEYAQEQSTAYKAIKKQCNIQPQAAKLAFKLDDMEESKRDDFLRSLNGLLKALSIFMPTDLVDQAEGKAGATDSVVPTGQRSRPRLATVPSHPADDSDLVEAANGDDDVPAQEAAE